MNSSKYSVGTVLCAIGLSIIASIVFYVSFVLSSFLLILLFSFLGDTILSFLLHNTENTPESLAAIVSSYIGYYSVVLSSDRIVMKDSTKKLTFIFLGISLSLFNVIYMIQNIFWGDPFFINIFMIVVGIIFFFKGKNTYIQE